MVSDALTRKMRSMPQNVDDLLIAWIAEGLKGKGKKGKELASRLGRDASVVSRILSGKRSVKVRELDTIANYLGMPPPDDLMLVNDRVPVHEIKVIGVVAEGIWRQADLRDDVEEALLDVPVSKRFPGVERFALRVEGQSMNKTVPEGYYVICVPYAQVRETVQEDDLVVIERADAGKVEASLKRVKFNGNRVELWPESHDSRFQKAVDFDDADVANQVDIIGLVIGRYADN